MEHDIELLLPAGTVIETAPQAEAIAKTEAAAQPPAAMPDEIIIEAKRQITLRCGKSSITLYPNGKIVLRGDYILSDADGINRIAGGQIELN